MKNRGLLIVGGGVVALIGLAVAWWLVSPLFLNRTVEEDFPASVEDIVIEDGQLVAPSMDEIEQMDEEERAAVQEQVEEAARDMPDTVAEDPMPEEGEPVVVLSGEFVGASDFYQGSGAATIYRLADGSHVLRFENFEVTNGPDLHVYLSGAPNPTNRADVMTEPSVDLGPLKGNRGSQNYEIPADVDIESVQSIVIYCVPFHVLFSSATLSG